VLGPREIVTNRLTLRPPTVLDRSLWVRLHRDPALYEHALRTMPGSDELAADGFRDCLGRWESVGFDYGVVEESSRRAGVGVGGLRRRVLDDQGEVLNLYYRLAASVQGRGLATEAARAWTAHAVEWLPDLPVVVKVKELHVRSVRVAQAAGLERVGAVALDDDAPDEAPSTVLQAPRVAVPDHLDGPTRESLLDLWCAVNDIGGAVGFLPGAPRRSVAAALAAHERGMAEGTTTLVLLRGAGDRVVGAGFWVADGNPLFDHTRTAYRVMTHPEMQGRNLGRLVLAAMHRVAREQGIEVAVLDVRSGLGVTRFYERMGYVEVGRVPGVIRVAPGDDRDRVLMARRLDGRRMVADGRA
jgi:RimJ/RimL family protein N-acetyltransferase